MDFRQLKYLYAVAEYRNVTKAAESLYISQSALSHYIRKAEEELGVQLFDRSTVPISLTHAGQCYISSVQRILMENERLMKELREISQNMTGVLRIGTSRERASYTMPKLVRDFNEMYPGIRVDIFTQSSQQLKEALKTGRIDLLLLPEAEKESDATLLSEKIYTEELLLCAAKGKIKQENLVKGSPCAVDMKTMEGKPFFVQFHEHASRIFFDAYCSRNHIRTTIGNEFSSNITSYRMAAAGLGYAIVPYMVTQLSDPGSEVELYSLGAEPVTWDVKIYYRKDAYLGQPEQDMIKLTEKLFSRETLSRNRFLPQGHPKMSS